MQDAMGAVAMTLMHEEDGKRVRRIVDSYIDVRLPCPDAKVAGVLAIGIPIKYEVRRGCNISDKWVVTHVSPFILQQEFPR
jgi:hypothetical protein